MLKVENVIAPSPEQWKAVILGMRNPMNSWEKSDSVICDEEDCRFVMNNMNDNVVGCDDGKLGFCVGKNDLDLMKRLCKAGVEHRKFMRMLPIMMDITAPIYWWKEYDTYKVATVANSTSTMHKIHSKRFSMDDFSCDHMTDSTKAFMETVVEELEKIRQRFKETKSKEDWYDLIQLLPGSYNQKRTVSLNYEVASNIIRQRTGHKLDEWNVLVDELRKLPYMKELLGET